MSSFYQNEAHLSPPRTALTLKATSFALTQNDMQVNVTSRDQTHETQIHAPTTIKRTNGYHQGQMNGQPGHLYVVYTRIRK
jgi:hypothetical protein